MRKSTTLKKAVQECLNDARVAILRHEAGLFENINTYMKQHWTSVDDAYRFALVTELIRDGLITGSKRSKTSGLNRHNLSTLGERSLEYIFSPNEPYDVE